MVPRSQGKVPGRHGTFDDCIARLPEIAALGFDVVYLTPIHPIGMANRKGRNNALKAAPDDPGSPYAIGSSQGGHDAVHPELGTLADFRRFVDACQALNMEVALDFAVQCSPDHPWLKEHPDWFERRPDGWIRYAENPPKKYEDIVNPDFYCADRIALWQALRDVIRFAATTTAISCSACTTRSPRTSCCRCRMTRWCTANARSSAACRATNGSDLPTCAPTTASCSGIRARS